jgi:hypothetical protein
MSELLTKAKAAAYDEICEDDERQIAALTVERDAAIFDLAAVRAALAVLLRNGGPCDRCQEDDCQAFGCDCDCFCHSEQEQATDQASKVLSLPNPGAELLAELQKFREDLKQASGECLVSMPEPGTELSRVLIANRLLRVERDASAWLRRLEEVALEPAKESQ